MKGFTKTVVPKRTFLRIRTAISVVAAVALVFGSWPIPQARAAALTGLKDTLGTLDVGQTTSHTILFTTPTGVAAGETITVTFPANFTNVTNLTVADMDLEDDGVDVTLAGTCSGTTWGAAVASQTVTFTSCTGTIAATSQIGVKLGSTADGPGTNRITNNSAGNDLKITIAGTMVDSGSLAVALNTNADVAVSATVDPFLSFNVTQASLSFGTYTGASSRYANTTTGSATDVSAHDITASTNATSGYTLTVQGATLTSSAAGNPTISNIATSGGEAASGGSTEQFGMYITASGGTGITRDTDYDDDSTPKFYFNGTSAADTMATASGPTGTTTYSVHYLGSVTAQTEAGTYNTTLSYVATANF